MSNPESVREFAGTGYFFGLELYKKLGIPIGLIESCWGGTEIEGWISKESLSQVPEYSETVEMLSQYPEDYKERETRYFRELDEWIASTEVAEKRFYEGKDLRTWALGSYDDSSWREVRFPGFLQDQEPLEIVSNGIYYCRKTVEIPQEWAGKDLDLYFSSVDDRDITFFNGVEVGHRDYYLDRRNYKVPGNIVRPGKAVIGLRIVDNAGKCSIGGENGRQLYVQGPDGKKIDLSGMWKYKIPDWQASFAWNISFVESALNTPGPLPPITTTSTSTSTTTTTTTTSTTSAVPPVTTSTQEIVPTKKGDTNCDDTVELADAILIMQSLANPNKYGVGGSDAHALTEQGRANADVDKSVKGLTSGDALRIQEYLLHLADSLD